jgi:hypothetical protein
LILDQHNAIRDINLITVFINGHLNHKNVTRLVSASKVT